MHWRLDQLREWWHRIGILSTLPAGAGSARSRGELACGLGSAGRLCSDDLKVAQYPGIRQGLSVESVESHETRHASEPASEVEENRTRAGVPDPVLHDLASPSR